MSSDKGTTSKIHTTSSHPATTSNVRLVTSTAPAFPTETQPTFTVASTIQTTNTELPTTIEASRQQTTYLFTNVTTEIAPTSSPQGIIMLFVYLALLGFILIAILVGLCCFYINHKYSWQQKKQKQQQELDSNYYHSDSGYSYMTTLLYWPRWVVGKRPQYYYPPV